MTASIKLSSCAAERIFTRCISSRNAVVCSQRRALLNGIAAGAEDAQPEI